MVECMPLQNRRLYRTQSAVIHDEVLWAVGRHPHSSPCPHTAASQTLPPPLTILPHSTPHTVSLSHHHLPPCHPSLQDTGYGATTSPSSLTSTPISHVTLSTPHHSLPSHSTPHHSLPSHSTSHHSLPSHSTPHQ